MTSTLSFNKIKFYGYHGLHEEESLTGNYFIINIDAVLRTDFKNEKPTFKNSVDYEELYSVLQNAFNQREHLIESVAFNIYNALKNKFSQVEKWTVSIEKQNPLGVGSFNPKFTIEG